jgi:hypothetical protein
MKKFKPLFFMILMFSSFLTLNAQTYSKSVTVKDFGTWDKTVSPANKISISSYVTKQKILAGISQNTVTSSPKYRYELILQSNSVYDGKLTKTWIFGARVFIDGLEVTREQSPDGFVAIINTEPTIIFKYDSSLDTINIKITWKSSRYFQGR